MLELIPGGVYVAHGTWGGFSDPRYSDAINEGEPVLVICHIPPCERYWDKHRYAVLTARGICREIVISRQDELCLQFLCA